MKFYIETYGCSRNQVDSEAIAGALAEEHEPVESAEGADIIVVNTCIVKTPTENKVLKAIKKYAELNKKLIVAGCMPEVQLEELKKVAPGAEFWGVKHDEVLEGSRIRVNRIIGITPISSGCLGTCAYCQTRFARGKLNSYPIEKIIKAVENAVEEGCKEIWITAQDTSAYGRDIGKKLPELLENVCKVEGNFKVRVGMMNPSHVLDMLPELVEAFKHEKMFKFLHLPVQSGNDRVLKAMNRRYSVFEFKRIVSSFKTEIPDLTLSTDVIVGYPGETEEQFKDSVELVKEVEPDIVNISRFGARPGTKAAELKDFPDWVKKERSRALTKVCAEIGRERNKRWVGWKGKVLVDEVGKKKDFVGRNFAYKPVVVKGKDLLGKEIEVEIKSITKSYLMS